MILDKLGAGVHPSLRKEIETGIANEAFRYRKPGQKASSGARAE